MSASKWKPYPDYKKVEIKWKSSIPYKWEKVRLRFLGKTYAGLTGKKGEDFSKESKPNFKPYIPYTNILNQTYISKNHFDYVFMDEGERQNLAKAKDLFFLMSSESYQDLGKSSILLENIDELYLNSFCKGFRISEPMIAPLFLNYQLQGNLHKQLISIQGKGFTRINLSQERLLDTPIFIPSISEQEQIGNFVHQISENISRNIGNLRNQISLLKEKRSALITKIVTKGLNPDAEMKDSGIDWVEKIPQHWQEVQLRWITQMQSGTNITSVDIESEGKFPVFGGNGLRGYTDKYTHHGNYVLIGRQGALCGCINYAHGKFWPSEHAVVVSPTIKLDYLWLGELLTVMNLGQYSQSAAQPGLSVDRICGLKIPLPPYEEQQEISRLLKYNQNLFDRLNDLITHEMKALEIFRTALISAAVTGKIDVRGHNNE
jgi:type I restriction enzyme, S subunit